MTDFATVNAPCIAADKVIAMALDAVAIERKRANLGEDEMPEPGSPLALALETLASVQAAAIAPHAARKAYLDEMREIARHN